jgi:hypothetical protein
MTVPPMSVMVTSNLNTLQAIPPASQLPETASGKQPSVSPPDRKTTNP